MSRTSASVAGSPDHRHSAGTTRGNRTGRGSLSSPLQLALKLTITVAFVAGLLVAPAGPGTASAAQDVEFMTAATAPAPDAPVPAELSQGELNSAVSTARAEWEAAVPGSDLSGVSASIVDLPDLAARERIGELDPDRCIRGWAWLGCYEPHHGRSSRTRPRGRRRSRLRRPHERIPVGGRSAGPVRHRHRFRSPSSKSSRRIPRTLSCRSSIRW